VNPEWLDFVDARRRRSLLAILVELSRLQRKENLNFVLIGALPLLLSGYLRYTALWDIDLLFSNKDELEKFTKHPKSERLRIVDYDEAMMVSENIASFHSAWTFDKNWFNVDYILQDDLFEFFSTDLTSSKPFHQMVLWQEIQSEIVLYQAHPWDIIVTKIVSPRAIRDLSLRVDMSIDIRHIFATYELEKDNPLFWQHITSRAQFFCSLTVFKRRFLELLMAAHELGYEDLEISPTAAQELKES
jgi:hypothetical protein